MNNNHYTMAITKREKKEKKEKKKAANNFT